MTAHAAAVHAASHADRRRIDRLGLALFITSESFLFFVLISTRYALTGTARPDDMNQILGVIVTAVLLSSSVSGYRALVAARRGDTHALIRFLRLTLALGTVFMVGLALEWAEGFAAFPPSRPYGSAFFTLTGMHGFHVLSGLGVVAALLVNARRGRFSAERHWAVEAGLRYWTFVDVVWLFIYPTLYLI